MEDIEVGGVAMADNTAPGDVQPTVPSLAHEHTLMREGNESTFTEMGEGVLAAIARDLVYTIRRSVTVDWMSRENVRARMRSTIKRLLVKLLTEEY